MTLRPLPFVLALSLAALHARPASADDHTMLGVGPRAIPAPPASTAPLPEMRSVGLVVSGLSVGGLGVAGAIAGLFLMNTASPSCGTVLAPCSTKRDLGETILMISAPVVGIGLIMAIVGAQPAPSPPDQAVSLAPEVMVGPTGGALRWRF